jgi:hypothetical protein
MQHKHKQQQQVRGRQVLTSLVGRHWMLGLLLLVGALKALGSSSSSSSTIWRRCGIAK